MQRLVPAGKHYNDWTARADDGHQEVSNAHMMRGKIYCLRWFLEYVDVLSGTKSRAMVSG